MSIIDTRYTIRVFLDQQVEQEKVHFGKWGNYDVVASE